VFGYSSSNSLICVDFYVGFAFCFERFKSVLFSLSCALKVDFLCSMLYANFDHRVCGF
jgi:hypothetical protein